MTKLQFTGLNAHGGDVQMYGIKSLPKGQMKKLTDVESRILARGETSGHCHVITGDVEMVEIDGEKYAVVGNDGAFHQHYKEAMLTEQTFNVNDNISNADHVKPCPIPAGIYKIGIDQQYDPNNGMFTKNLD